MRGHDVLYELAGGVEAEVAIITWKLDTLVLEMVCGLYVGRQFTVGVISGIALFILGFYVFGSGLCFTNFPFCYIV